jgi:hypothetical protein
MMCCRAASESEREAAAGPGDRRSFRASAPKKNLRRQAVNSPSTFLPQLFHMASAVGILVVLLTATARAQAIDAGSMFRVFLTDGQAVPSFGESAVVGDRVIFTIIVGDGSIRTTMQLVSLPVTAVDLFRTARYAESMRAARYAATHGEADYAAMTAEVERAVQELTRIQDPKRRLALAEEAKRRLLTWSQEHYSYRADDVHKLAGMFDEVIAELRAAAGESKFSLDLVAGSAAAQMEPLLPLPTLRESVAMAIAASRVADVAAERQAILRAATTATAGAPGAEDLATSVHQRLGLELTADAAYAALAAALLSRADTAMRRADVDAVAEARRQAIERDRELGSLRPHELSALMAGLDAKLEAARTYRLALDHYAYARRGRLDYEKRVRPAMTGFDGLRPMLESIRDMRGTPFERLTVAYERLKGFAADLARIAPPGDLTDVHATLSSSVHMAIEALERRRRAVIVASMADARDASSAAAGAVLLADQARNTLVQRLFPPKIDQ